MLNQASLRGIATGLVCAVLALIISRTPFGEALDHWSSDACFLSRGSRPTTAKIAIIWIDDATFDELRKPAAYLSPELARAIRYCSRQGATAIGVDYFIGAEQSDRKPIADPQAGDPHSEQGRGLDVAQAAEETQRVVLPAFFNQRTLELRRPLTQWEVATQTDRPTPFGLLNLTNDADHFVRRQVLMFDPTVANEGFPKFFSLALYSRSRNESAVRDGDRVRVGDRQIPVDDGGRMTINFVGPAGTDVFPQFPLWTVLAAERQSRTMPEFDGAIVIIGANGAGQQDHHPTPFSNGAARLFSSPAAALMSGTEIHAHTIATMHDQLFLTRPPWLAPLPWTLLVGIGLGATFARVSFPRGAAVLAAFLFVLAFATYALFVVPGWLLKPVPLVLTALTTCAAVATRRWRQAKPAMTLPELEPRIVGLERSVAGLGQELRLAWEYIHPDPGSSLTKSRLVMEKLLNIVYTLEQGHEPRKPLIGDMLADNQFTRKIERRILSRMNAVRDLGNLGPHGERVQPNDAAHALDDLCEVLDWYLRRYAASSRH